MNGLISDPSSAGRFVIWQLAATKNDRALIAFSGKLIALTIGLRFLTDYLPGDTYFCVRGPQHNPDRCRSRFRLVDRTARQEEARQRFVENLRHPHASGRMGP